MAPRLPARGRGTRTTPTGFSRAHLRLVLTTVGRQCQGPTPFPPGASFGLEDAGLCFHTLGLGYLGTSILGVGVYLVSSPDRDTT